MAKSKDELTRAVLELLWEQWTALGVSGWTLGPGARSSDASAVDPEALILMTAAMGDDDPRLRDEATDWCISYGQYLSKARLKNLLRIGVADESSFHGLAATVNAHAHLGWPDGGLAPRQYKPRARSAFVARGNTAAIRLRARLVFGVSARAELLVLLGTEPQWGSSASELAARVYYGRRNVVEALEALTLTGLVRGNDAPGGRRYALADPIALHSVLGPTPGYFVDWGRAFRACWIALRTLRDFAAAPATVQVVEAVKSAAQVQAELMRSWAYVPGAPPSGTSAWDEFAAWSLRLVDVLRDPSQAGFAPRRRQRAPRVTAKAPAQARA
jgi:hypothetical protein